MKKTIILKFALALSVFASSILSLTAQANNAHLLFVQISKSAEITPSKDDPKSYTLTLKQVEPYTSYFTDRPSRRTGLIQTTKFINAWQQQDIQKSPPNVALETMDVSNGGRINHVFELSSPVYNNKTHQLTYNAKLLSSKPGQQQSLPSHNIKTGYTVLFIDDFNWNGSIFGN